MKPDLPKNLVVTFLEVLGKKLNADNLAVLPDKSQNLKGGLKL